MKNFKKIFLVALLGLFLFSSASAVSLFQVQQGGSGVGTITGIIQGNGTSPFSAITVGSGLQFTGGTLSATNSGTVTSVSGTSNRITSTGGATPVIDISSSYVGQASIITLGTIGTGVWQGTPVGILYGGTGQTTANAAFNALVPSQSSNNGKYLTTDGSNTSWSPIPPVVATTTINSATGPAFTFSTGTTGTDFAIGSSGSTVTFNLPTASASNRGALSTTDWTTFNNKVSTSRAINTTAPITGGGDLSADRTIACNVASGSQAGCLSSADWTTFNGKQAAGNYITALTGDATASGPGSAALTLATVNSNVGTFGSATQAGVFTVNGKGLITAASNTTITLAVGSITGLGTGVATFLATPSSANLLSAMTDKTGTGLNVFAISPTLTSPSITTSIFPTSNDGAPLGDTTHQFSDLFLAEGGVINWDNGDATLTQVGDVLTLAGAELDVPDVAYSSAWDGSTAVPTRNAVYDANFETDNTIKAYQALGSSIKAQSIGRSMFDISVGLAISSGTIKFMAVYLPRAQTLTGVKWFQQTKGSYTADQYNGVGLYSYSAGTLTLVASSANDGTIWQTATTGTYGSKAFSSTYPALAGIYFIGILYHSSAVTTVPALGEVPALLVTGVVSGDFTNSAILNGNLAGQTSFPSSQSISGLTVSSAPLWLAIY